MDQDIVKKIHKTLIKKRKTIAIAESCTGGLISKLLTDIPDSSKYFILGMVTYSNEMKENVLRIPYFIIAQNGAVSKEVASLMARNVRIIAKTDFGIGITGIAGPTGGTIRKPVGTVFISIDSHKGQICNKFLLKGNRSAIRKTAALKSLELLKPLI